MLLVQGHTWRTTAFWQNSHGDLTPSICSLQIPSGQTVPQAIVSPLGCLSTVSKSWWYRCFPSRQSTFPPIPNRLPTHFSIPLTISLTGFQATVKLAFSCPAWRFPFVLFYFCSRLRTITRAHPFLIPQSLWPKALPKVLCCPEHKMNGRMRGQSSQGSEAEHSQCV